MSPDGDAFASIIQESGRRSRGRWQLVVALVAVLAIAGGLVAWLRPAFLFGKPEISYVTANVQKGDLTETIEATGTVEPVLKVTVGAQVSGRVSHVHVDFNDVVTKGQLLAELEAAPFEAELAQARAALSSAEAQLAKARVDTSLQEKNLARTKQLVEGGLSARADLDSSQSAFDAAQAQVQVALAQVEQQRANVARARENLGYTKIAAPIDGTVISRTVEPGQTVAASLQAPELFVIANDLTTMQVMASIDEADVGKVQESGEAEVRVDAFPNEIFRGVVRELRVQPTTTSGVVTYPAVVDVPNAERKLRPGMTATVTLATASREGVLKVPNAALRYEPRGGGMRGPRGAAPRGGAGAAEGGAEGGARKRGGKRIYAPPAVEGEAPRAIDVVVGISDDAFTEVSGDDVKEGMAVIVDEEGAPGGAPTSGRRPPRVL